MDWPWRDYKKFLEAYLAERGDALPETAGELVSTNGKVMGEHTGVHNFTVGQRKGLGVATGSPLYVLEIKGDTGQVVIGDQENLYSRTLRVERTNLIAAEDLPEPLRVGVKIRHRHEAAPATVERAGKDEILVRFDQPQRAVTPGQAAVFYDGDVVVGGGWIA
jgi:tRNA-specific 2-thiouridylase